jgi:hypothetical protein
MEYREPVLDIGTIIKFVDENTCDFDFISRSSSVNEIVKNENFFLSWDSTRRNRSWSLLNSPFLVVSVNRFMFFKMIWTSLLANDALS